MGKRTTNPIRKRRLRLALTQEEFAGALNPTVSTQTVKLWEWGKFKPSGRSLVALASLFGVQTKTLIDEYEEWKNESDEEETRG